MSGKMPAHITAKMVMVSPARLIDVRQRWRSRNKMAEINVPACPMPIHHTKLMMAQPHMTGCCKPQMPTPVDIRYRIMTKQIVMKVTLMAKQIFHHLGVSPSITPAMRSEIQPMLRLFVTNGSRSNAAGGPSTRNDGWSFARVSVIDESISAFLLRQQWV